ncbi:secretion system protein [Comamonas serinivorans]|uniref:Secretion system protein n=1 Tax=Comamonas serinivorans TaxID=1082851 RepID=A0A1Y0EL48_9BURK|nr:type II secretion system F family protein [Comamonas serinivorans]ARU04354.1 secretion system protein [Comamonas serinivorans]
MTAAMLVLGALACALLALALWLFARAQRQQAQQAIASNLQRSLDIQREMQAAAAPASLPVTGAAPPLMASAAPVLPAPSTLQQWLDDRLGYSAWGVSPGVIGLLIAGGLLLATLVALQGDLAIGALVALAYGLLCCFGIWLRLSKRRAKMLSQLPSFLDNMVRLISIGNSPHAAFKFASGNVPEPLGRALGDVSAALNVSPDLGQAMAQLERTWKLPEFGLLAAVFRMSTRYGGRADQVLERVSAYIRDRQSAERELHALSAEVRLSAWVLALLPILVGGLIMVLNQGYFMRMWNDPVGQKMILAAAALQALGSFFLYRLARLK